MNIYLDAIVVLLTFVGLLFFHGTTVGILRFPDFYTRMHAAGKGDTLSTMLILFGFAAYQLHHPSTATLLVAGKIIFIAVLVFIASPTATHAIMDAGYESEIGAWSAKDGFVSSCLIRKEKGE
ncbi:MAG: monovalent cation/H(+) antiporter subunit G [Desulfoarculaceae bacterium]|nr:monovalent cation/H(+) antiporter subunit G [Desulfoarculaceae bacterium]